MRGRVWVAAALLTGAGSMYGYYQVKEQNEDRAKVLEASRAIGRVKVPYTGGGPIPLPTPTPEPTVVEETPVPPPKPAPVAQPEPVAQAEPPPPQIIYVVTTAEAPPAPQEEPAEEQAVATNAAAPVTYDPNVPYIYPTAVVRPVFPVALPTEPFVQGSAGSAPIGDNGAGGGAVSPSTTMAGGTPAGSAGDVPVGSVTGTPVGNAGGTSIGNAGGITSFDTAGVTPFGVAPVAPFGVPFGAFGVPIGPVNPFFIVQ